MAPGKGKERLKILDRYLAGVVTKFSLGAFFILLAMVGLFDFLGRLDDLKGDFGAPEAFAYTLLTLPRWGYDLVPTAVLIGGLLGLGNLAAGSELVVLRGAGLSIARIARPVMVGGMAMMLLGVVLGEWVAPPSEAWAQQLRAEWRGGYIGLRGKSGFWARDGESFIRIRRILPEGRLEGIAVYRFREHRLEMSLRAKRGDRRGGGWVLHDVRVSRISPQGVETERWPEMVWETTLQPALIDVLAIRPEQMGFPDLLEYVGYLRSNGLEYQHYELALWRKIVKPLSSLVMLLIALPFVFGPLRSANSGLLLLAGVLIGLGFYILDQIMNNAGLVYGLPPALSALAPTLLFAAGALFFLRRA